MFEHIDRIALPLTVSSVRSTQFSAQFLQLQKTTTKINVGQLKTPVHNTLLLVNRA